jgi:hypothetical protein
MNARICNMKPCSLAEILQRFYKICSLHLKCVLKTETSLYIHQPIWCYIPEIHNLHDHPPWEHYKISHSNFHGLPPSHNNFHGLQHFLQRGSLNRADFMSDACALQKVEVVVMALHGNMKQCALAVQVWMVLLWGLPRTPRHVGRTPAASRHLGEYSSLCSLYRVQALD